MLANMGNKKLAEIVTSVFRVSRYNVNQIHQTVLSRDGESKKITSNRNPHRNSSEYITIFWK